MMDDRRQQLNPAGVAAIPVVTSSTPPEPPPPPAGRARLDTTGRRDGRSSMTDEPGTYEEWRVTGDHGGGFPPYEFTWSPFRNPQLGDPEAGARGFVALIAKHGGWPDGPHLHHRTVTVTEWRAAEMGA